MHGPQVQRPVPVLPVLSQGHPQNGRDLKNRLGSPDLLVMFTDTISHKMVQNALNETRGQDTVIVRSRSQLHVRPGLHSGDPCRCQELIDVRGLCDPPRRPYLSGN